MKYLHYLIFGTLLFLNNNISAQNKTQVREFQLNNDEPGATYNFSFVHITDIHVGEGEGDYGTYGFLNDTMPVGDVGFAAQRLRNVVHWINENASEKNIKFVVVTGDITDSGERSEFEKAKEILDALEIPYVPTIGNHDIWPYVRYEFEAPYAYGDSVMFEVFKDVYDKAKDFFDMWDDGTRLTPTFNPESNRAHYHQNFSFSYQGVGFFAFDFNPRYHVNKNEPGIGPEAKLNNSLEWLIQSINSFPLKGRKNLILFSHQPPHNDILALFNGLSKDEHDKMTKALAPFSEHLALWMAGHVHRNTHYKLRSAGKIIMDVKETAANKEYNEGFLTLVNVYSVPTITSTKDIISMEDIKLYPNPSTDRLRIEFPLPRKFKRIEIFNSAGLKMWDQSIPTSTHFEINLRDWNSGNYILQLISDDEIVYKKFTKIP